MVWKISWTVEITNRIISITPIESCSFFFSFLKNFTFMLEGFLTSVIKDLWSNSLELTTHVISQRVNILAFSFNCIHFFLATFFPSFSFLWPRSLPLKKERKEIKKPSLTSFDNISEPPFSNIHPSLSPSTILLITLAAPFDYYYTVFPLLALPYSFSLFIFPFLSFFL